MVETTAAPVTADGKAPKEIDYAEEMKREFEEDGRNVQRAVRRFTDIDNYGQGKYAYCYWGPMRDY